MVYTPNSDAIGRSEADFRRNVELKAALPSLSPVRDIARRLTTEQPALEHQIDTYFTCQNGRLKLREINGHQAQLIWYRRPDTRSAKTSQYFLVAVPEPAQLKRLLGASLGVRCVVDKQREIYWYQNVRIHLDQVAGCGCFLEFEAVLTSTDQVADGRKRVDWLCGQFQIAPELLVAGSYADMSSGKASPGGE